MYDCRDGMMNLCSLVEKPQFDCSRRVQHAGNRAASISGIKRHHGSSEIRGVNSRFLLATRCRRRGWETRVVGVENMRITASVTGDPRTPALVLLHGWPHCRQIFADVLGAFGEDFYAIAFDLPGIGDSHGAPRQAERAELANAILQAAETLGVTSFGL